MNSSPRAALVGALTALSLVVATGLLGASYLGLIGSDLTARANLTTAGDSLGVGSDVKYRGLRVGRVLSVDADADEPSAEIVLMSEHADQIPADVTARLLPGTLFGNEYVDLVSDTPASVAHLQDGASIPADTSARTLRLMDTFSATQRLLVAVDPARVDAAVGAVAEALAGRGDELGGLVDDAAALMTSWQANEATFFRDLELVSRNVDLLADLEPGIVATVRDVLPLARTLAERREATRALLGDAAVLVGDLATWAEANVEPFARVLAGTAATLSVFARRSAPFELSLSKLPTVLSNGAAAVQGNAIQMNGALALDFPDPYSAEDCPRYGPLSGSNCPGGER